MICGLIIAFFGCTSEKKTETKETSDEINSPSVSVSDSDDGLVFTVAGVQFTMVYVKGGNFWMGTSSNKNDVDKDERPAHEVTLNDFYIGQTEVTQELWEAVIGSSSRKVVGHNLPMTYISWDDCQVFVERLNQLTGRSFRLPTEAEWEYAARGGQASKGYVYAGSDNVGDVAWCREYLGDDRIHPVGKKNPNELGIYDMSGNVWEWCQDRYNAAYYKSSPKNNPTGAASGSYRVYRGGGWNNTDSYLRVVNRNYGKPSYTFSAIGMRLVL